MDKTNITSINIRQREGFALLITLSVLSVLISLTLVLLSYFEEVQNDASDTTAMIQADVYYADITKIFDRFEKKKQLFSTLYMFPVPLRTSDGRFVMNLSCQPLSKGANINWLGMEGTSSMQEAYSFTLEIFEMLVQQYDLEDSTRLQEMILEEIDGEKNLITKEYSRLRQKKGIISYKQFSQIVSRYQMEVDDPNASNVPWKQYFTFSNRAKRIDAEYATPEIISMLFDINLQSVREWQGDPDKGSLSSFVSGNGGEYASREKLIVGKKFLEESECSVTFNATGRPYKFRFEYIRGEAKHFEFYER